MHTDLIQEGRLQHGGGSATGGGFSHEAMFYSGPADFVDGAAAFIREGLEAEEPVLVVVGAQKIDYLRAELGRDAERVRFADMRDVGLNPARIIPAWDEFVRECASRGSFRGIGEPIWAGRYPAELIEAQRHEALLNLAFAGSGPWRLLCPYDVDSLSPEVLQEARRTHPTLIRDRTQTRSASFLGLDAISEPFDAPLPEPPTVAAELRFGSDALASLRSFVVRTATELGLDTERASDLVLAVNEVATNTVRHANGSGRLRMWTDKNAVVAEISDEGHIDQPLIGRRRPSTGAEGGYGLWLANQLCDLVQIRMFPAGNTIRLHLSR